MVKYTRRGDDMDKTTLFDIEELNEALVQTTLDEVYDALKEKGYNPVSQIVGYLISGDPGYISSYNDSRKKISKLERNHIVEVLLRNYMK